MTSMNTPTSRFSSEKTPVSVTRREAAVLPTPPNIGLKSIDDVRLEMAKVYREMRRGDIESSNGTKLVYVLSQIGRIIETNQVAERIAAIERTIGRRL